MGVKVKVKELNLWELEGSIENSIEVLSKLKEENTGKELYLSTQLGEWDDTEHIEVYYMRPATKEEAQTRLEAEQEHNKHAIKYAKSVLKRLGVE